MSPVSLKVKCLTAAITSVWFVLVYNFTNWVTSHRSDLLIAAFSWEAYIPFVPVAVIPYWSIDLFFIAAPFFTRSQEELRAYRTRILLAIAIAGGFFLLFPLELQFKRPPVSGILGVLLSSLDKFNNYWNLAPSLHIALRTILWTVYMPVCSSLGRWLLGSWFVCIGLSTLLVWQHHVFDVFTGQLLGLFVIQVVHVSGRQPQTPLTGRHLTLVGRYLIASSACVLLFALVGLSGFLLLWPAVSFLVVALAYLRGDWRHLGKQGAKFSSSGWWLLLPYRAVARLWQRRYGSRASQVTPHVLFGSFPSADFIRTRCKSGIIDLTAEYPAVADVEKLAYVNVPMLDLVCPPPQQVQEAVQTLNQMSVRGEVYVHCALGLSRSALVVAAWLLSRGEVNSAKQAEHVIREICPQVVFKAEERQLLEALSSGGSDAGDT